MQDICIILLEAVNDGPWWYKYTASLLYGLTSLKLSTLLAECEHNLTIGTRAPHGSTQSEAKELGAPGIGRGGAKMMFKIAP
jgi:hypothetical protein